MAIDGIGMGAGGAARVLCGNGCSCSLTLSVCVDEEISSVLNTGDIGVAGNSVVGTLIFGVGGGLSGCSTVCTALEVIVHGAGLALLNGLRDSNNSDVRFLRWLAWLWFASTSVRVGELSTGLDCTGASSTVCEEASTIAGRTGDVGGEG